MSAHPFEARLNSIDRAMQAGFERLDQRFAQIDHRFAQVDQRFAQVDQRFALIDHRFNWLMGIVVVTWVTTVGAWTTTILTLLYHH
ncbi:MAG: hypothetical protein JO101_09680 [Candidatus Eremiobacteraeota bacterium]|nr:hypothetical protein [Candidatus Eremiobacteraeota bacterium]MBV8355579.1 hypothetical protein [Candidatus Eremiobacteraeota bacterium]